MPAGTSGVVKKEEKGILARRRSSMSKGKEVSNSLASYGASECKIERKERLRLSKPMRARSWPSSVSHGGSFIPYYGT